MFVCCACCVFFGKKLRVPETLIPHGGKCVLRFRATFRGGGIFDWQHEKLFISLRTLNKLHETKMRLAYFTLNHKFDIFHFTLCLSNTANTFPECNRKMKSTLYCHIARICRIYRSTAPLIPSDSQPSPQGYVHPQCISSAINISWLGIKIFMSVHKEQLGRGSDSWIVFLWIFRISKNYDKSGLLGIFFLSHKINKYIYFI